ncbi:UDP-glucuronate 4-epimerase [Paenibacillus cellulosilyticus]|uniref:UDP-glucuronate 4-epimerase n=1 Tax=Paenibacillus cellulosilyticus TaxID=375489 RepID=A0A2V2YJA2_9BACL|nr:GDP-mannose 4,6-dehydratase [Paenibacillus cellulosilyticus]PWV92054.1 UDP-glucuronate 4-epimerase [Paenibacillus cellulosilyticus]QKS46735.1 GDP-mannose 4,6-dehydratase [Paenibacillus cellulosilyticus]
MTTYCVTGGAGFIGSHLCERLLRLGHRVLCIDSFNDVYDYRIKIGNVLNSTGSTESLSFTDKQTDLQQLPSIVNRDNYKLVVADIRDRASVNAVFASESIDVVIHLAAMAGVRPSIEDPMLYEEVNVKGTMHMLEAMRRHNVRKWLCASSSSVYGNQKKLPFSELDVVDRMISPYAATKKSCEVMGHTYFHLFGIDTIMLRFFTVYGERQRPDLAIHKFMRMLDNGDELTLYGDGSSRRDYTHIDDIIQGMLGALHYIETEERVYEIINLGTHHTVTLIELVQTLERCSGRSANIRWMPDQPGDVEQTYADVTKANRLFGYDPKTDFEEGIARFVTWYRGERKW